MEMCVMKYIIITLVRYNFQCETTLSCLFSIVWYIQYVHCVLGNDWSLPLSVSWGLAAG